MLHDAVYIGIYNVPKCFEACQAIAKMMKALADPQDPGGDNKQF